MKHDGSKNAGGRSTPSDLDGEGYSKASYKPGYPLDKSLQESSESDMKRGFKKDC